MLNVSLSFRRLFILFLAMNIMLGQVFMASSVFANQNPTTKVRHKSPNYFVSDYRIKLEADVSDKQGVKLVRCYFRAAGEENFVFVTMMNTGKNVYQGILPAPAANTGFVEYLFLAVNQSNQIVKTQTFMLQKDDSKKTPAWQEVSTDGNVLVSTELEAAPEMLSGFSDNIVIDVVESGMRFGIVVGGLYAANAAVGSTSGAAAAATSAGSVSAGTGVSTGAIVLGGITAAAAAAAGVAVAVEANEESSSSGGGGGGGKCTYGCCNPNCYICYPNGWPF